MKESFVVLVSNVSKTFSFAKRINLLYRVQHDKGFFFLSNMEVNSTLYVLALHLIYNSSSETKNVVKI